MCQWNREHTDNFLEVTPMGVRCVLCRMQALSNDLNIERCLSDELQSIVLAQAQHLKVMEKLLEVYRKICSKPLVDIDDNILATQGEEEYEKAINLYRAK